MGLGILPFPYIGKKGADNNATMNRTIYHGKVSVDNSTPHRKGHSSRKKEEVFADEIEAAWQSYFENHDQKSRDFLMEKHMHLVDNVARTFLYKKPTVFDMSDIKQAGAMGLMDAIQKFDAGKNVKFKTYAQFRIRGSILDAINKLDWTPRGIRKNIRDVIRASDDFRETNFREPDINDLVEFTKLPKDAIKLAMDQSARTFILPVEHNSLTDIESSMPTEQAQKSFNTLANSEDESDLRDVQLALHTELSRKEKRAIELRYFEEKTLVECSKALGVSIKDFKILLERAIRKLKRHFDDPEYPN